jgi:voltage-gated potassium channel
LRCVKCRWDEDASFNRLPLFRCGHSLTWVNAARARSPYAVRMPRAPTHRTHAARQRSFGLRLAPSTAGRAVRIERRWRLPTLLAQLVTIPAFYLDMLHESVPWLAIGAYLTAALMLGLALWHTARATGHTVAHVCANWLDVLLVLGLMAAALAPTSQGSDWVLLLRLSVAFLSLVRMVWCLQHLLTQGGILYLVALAFVVLLMCGVGFWWLEPRTPTLTDGLWLAFTTAATVGYGGVVPTTPASKIFAVFVVLLGFGVLTMVTAAIATAWIETEERRIEREILHDLRQQIGKVDANVAALRTEMRAAANLLASAAETKEPAQMRVASVRKQGGDR